MDRKLSLVSLVAFGLVLAGLAASPARADMSNMVAITAVPESIRTAASEAAPGVDRWLIAFHFPGRAPGQPGVYRLAGRNLTHLVVANVADNGRVLDIRRQISATEAPRQVLNALAIRAPDFTAARAEAVGKNERQTVYYEFEGQPGARPRAVLVGADGTKVMTYVNGELEPIENYRP